MTLTIALIVLAAINISNAATLRYNSWSIPAPVFAPRFSIYPDIDRELLDTFSTSTKTPRPPPPEVKSLHIFSNIANRYAHTNITSRVANLANTSQEVFFSVIIPETAFITGFSMEINGKTYKAYVKEKEEAKREYAEAVNRGQAAAHVHQSARDSERFSVSVNVEAQTKVTFTLTYEELLQRELGLYRHIININPGQIVPDLKIDVHIKELKNITEVHAKEIQSANEIDPDVGENPNAQVELINPTEAKIHFEADEKEQRRLEKLRKTEGSGVTGKFVIDYDVERDSLGGEVVVNDGYFVHFFAPKNLPPLRKHVLFVLDVSGSMAGRKIEQLQEAMISILDELKPDDIFNIIEFSYSVTVRNLDAEVNSAVYTPYSTFFNDFMPEQPNVPMDESTEPFPATPHYIEKAKNIIKKMTAGGGTNIDDALKTAIKIAKKGLKKEQTVAESVGNLTNEENKTSKGTPQPIIIFLTDGEPTVGETDLHKIQTTVLELNSDPKATIFSLAFGEGADFDFLKKISLANNGFGRQIYEAADAQMQLRNFYNHISSPLLSNVKFIYPPGQVDEQTLTKRIFSTLFKGSEMVVAGKIGSGFNSTQIEALALNGLKIFHSPIPEIRNSPESYGSLERLWAYLTIRQLLDEDAVQSASVRQYSNADETTSTVKTVDKPSPKEQALKIALKYSFVCPLTSLVVVKPDGKSDLNTESAAPGLEDGPIAPMAFQQASFSVNHHGLVGAGAAIRSPSGLQLPIPKIAFQRPSPFVFTVNRIQQVLPGPPVATTLNVPSFDRLDESQDATDSQENLSTPSTQEDELNSIPWLHLVRNGDNIVLNTTNGTITLRLKPLADESEECSIDGVSGTCRPLVKCVSEAKLSSLDSYTNKYFCQLSGDVAGMCLLEKENNETTATESATEESATLRHDESSTEDVLTTKEDEATPTSTEKFIESTFTPTENSTPAVDESTGDSSPD